MKKLIAITFLLAALAEAGPLKVATFPLLHPKKDAHAVKAVGRGLWKAGKAVAW